MKKKRDGIHKIVTLHLSSPVCTCFSCLTSSLYVRNVYEISKKEIIIIILITFLFRKTCAHKINLIWIMYFTFFMFLFFFFFFFFTLTFNNLFYSNVVDLNKFLVLNKFSLNWWYMVTIFGILNTFSKHALKTNKTKKKKKTTR